MIWFYFEESSQYVLFFSDFEYFSNFPYLQLIQFHSSQSYFSLEYKTANNWFIFSIEFSGSFFFKSSKTNKNKATNTFSYRTNYKTNNTTHLSPLHVSQHTNNTTQHPADIIMQTFSTFRNTTPESHPSRLPSWSFPPSKHRIIIMRSSKTNRINGWNQTEPHLRHKHAKQIQVN